MLATAMFLQDIFVGMSLIILNNLEYSAKDDKIQTSEKS